MVSSVKYWLASLARTMRAMVNEQSVLHGEYALLRAQIAHLTPGNPAAYGYKCYSQCDEDGIIAHLFEKLGSGARTFVEIGCSDGLENNTHALLLQGWRGAWIDADEFKMAGLRRELPANHRLALRQAFVSPDNVVALVQNASAASAQCELDFLSVDIDGRDLDVVVAAIPVLKPRVLCVEYNAKFPPPMQVAVSSKHSGIWSGDDYQGASLAAFVHALDPLGYVLVSCSASGVNAFFVRSNLAKAFLRYPMEALFQPARYHLRRLESGHPPSLKFLADALSQP